MLPCLAQGSVVKGDGTGLPAGRVAGEAWCGSHKGHCQGHGQGDAGSPLRLWWEEPQTDTGRRWTWKHRVHPEHRYADDTTLIAESEELIKPLDESERGE